MRIKFPFPRLRWLTAAYQDGSWVRDRYYFTPGTLEWESVLLVFVLLESGRGLRLGGAPYPTPGSRCSALASSTSMRLAADPLLRQWRDRGTDRLSRRARDDGKSLALVPGIVLFCIPSLVWTGHVFCCTTGRRYCPCLSWDTCWWSDLAGLVWQLPAFSSLLLTSSTRREHRCWYKVRGFLGREVCLVTDREMMFLQSATAINSSIKFRINPFLSFGSV